MEKILTLLRIICRGMTHQDKITFLQAHGFYSIKALENSDQSKLDTFKNFLENEVNKLPDYEVLQGYVVRKDQEKPSFILLDEKV